MLAQVVSELAALGGEGGVGNEGVSPAIPQKAMIAKEKKLPAEGKPQDKEQNLPCVKKEEPQNRVEAKEGGAAADDGKTKAEVEVETNGSAPEVASDQEDTKLLIEEEPLPSVAEAATPIDTELMVATAIAPVVTAEKEITNQEAVLTEDSQQAAPAESDVLMPAVDSANSELSDSQAAVETKIAPSSATLKEDIATPSADANLNLAPKTTATTATEATATPNSTDDFLVKAPAMDTSDEQLLNTKLRTELEKQLSGNITTGEQNSQKAPTAVSATEYQEKLASTLAQASFKELILENRPAQNTPGAGDSRLNIANISEKTRLAGDGAEKIKQPLVSKFLHNLERVEDALKEVSRSKDGKSISLRLDPPSLGSVKVDVSVRDGSLYARIVAEIPQAAQLLRERTPELIAMLRQAGVDVNEINVSVGGQGSKDSFLGDLFNPREEGSMKWGSGKGHTNSSNIEDVEIDTHQISADAAVDHWVA